MEEIRVSAKTLDEAKTQALLKLNTSSDHIEFSIVEEGSSGLLGFIGSKPWVISARVKSDDEVAAEAAKASIESEKAAQAFAAREDAAQAEMPVKEEVEQKKTEEELPVQDLQAAEAQAQADQAFETVKAAEAAEETEKETEDDAGKDAEGDSQTEPVSPEEAAELIKSGEDFLKSIFKVMDVDAEIKSEFNHDTNEIYYEFKGDDMGVLIGKRGQTLDSLQYLVSLVVNKHRNGYIRIKLDTENYRDRRKVKLEELAHNIAQKVKRSRHKVELEPMNPYERRIIHSALQNDPYVTTISEGDEPYRHVVVLLKRDQNRRRYGNGPKNRTK